MLSKFSKAAPPRPEKAEIRPALKGWPWLRLIPIGLVIIICVVAYHEWRGPQIHAPSGRFDDPLTAAFSIKNPTSLMPMDHMTFDCHLLSMTAAGVDGGQIQFKDNHLQTKDAPFILPPGQPSRLHCNVARIKRLEGDRLTTTVRMEIVAKYDEFGMSRVARSDRFNWDSQSKTWVEGTAVN